MSDKVKVETQTTKSTFNSSGGFETGVRDFLKKFPDNSAGTIIIRNVKKMWYKTGDDIIINNLPEKAECISYHSPVCPDCRTHLDKKTVKCLCFGCGLIINVTKKGDRYRTTVA